jgi:hypothetical protein
MIGYKRALLLPLVMAFAIAAYAQAPAQSPEDESVVRNQFSDWWRYWNQKDIDAGIKLKNAFEDDWKRAAKYESAYRDGEDPSNYLKRLDLSQAQFLCDWKETHAPGNPKPLAICESGSTLAKQAIDARDAARLIADKQAAEAKEAARSAAAKAKEAARSDAARREAAFDQAVGQMPTEEICRTYGNTRYKSARTELERRRALSGEEWTLVDQRKVKIGMSEIALLCSLGSTEVNRTVTAAGTHKQYVYSGRNVYVEDGTVVGFQD